MSFVTGRPFWDAYIGCHMPVNGCLAVGMFYEDDVAKEVCSAIRGRVPHIVPFYVRFRDNSNPVVAASVSDDNSANPGGIHRSLIPDRKVESPPIVVTIAVSISAVDRLIEKAPERHPHRTCFRWELRRLAGCPADE